MDGVDYKAQMEVRKLPGIDLKINWSLESLLLQKLRLFYK